jgi:hypothetical protein
VRILCSLCGAVAQCKEEEGSEEFASLIAELEGAFAEEEACVHTAAIASGKLLVEVKRGETNVHTVLCDAVM